MPEQERRDSRCLCGAVTVQVAGPLGIGDDLQWMTRAAYDAPNAHLEKRSG